MCFTLHGIIQLLSTKENLCLYVIINNKKHHEQPNKYHKSKTKWYDNTTKKMTDGGLKLVLKVRLNLDLSLPESFVEMAT